MRCNRDESRGAHYKPEFPKRDRPAFHGERRWLKHKAVGSVEYLRASTTLCAGKTVHITDEIDVSLVKPAANESTKRPRRQRGGQERQVLVRHLENDDGRYGW